MVQRTEAATAHIPPEQRRDPIAKLRVAQHDERNALGAKFRKESIDLRNKHALLRSKDRALSNGARATPEWEAKEASDRRMLEHDHADQRNKQAQRYRDEMAKVIAANPH